MGKVINIFHQIVTNIRQILGFIVGVIWGVIPLYGMVGIASFGLVNALVLFIYYTKYLGVDDEEYGRFELIQGFLQKYMYNFI